MMKKICNYLILLVFLYFLPSYSFGQDSPYYERPTERSLTNNEISLPNLKTEKVYWYFGGNGGIKLASQSLSNDINGSLSSSKINATYGEAYFGVNHDDKWQAELGYINNPFKLQWQLIDISLRAPLQFIANETSHGVSLKYKKRLFILDKVTKNTRINLSTGLTYAVGRKSETLADYRLRIPTDYGQNGPTDTLLVTTDFIQKAAPFSGELGFELINRLANPIEIGVFAKYILNGSDVIKGNIAIDSNFREAQNSELKLKRSNFMFGITIRWNFLHGIRYIPEIE
ncbi:hypothetical protein [Arcticibacterium luteifluviistationis]|uniref:Outer membrane protein beta-barrel domain-containing protein n=1 Tax=Arcticibacterium luteifluviistationis TaxID=1784714 RepID=A0A2Z4GDE0_9BACT|nr:hypothetical protein [Arcticibacterium luteifluviistationis]AWV99045.1 hypothetical protein DJ013_13070 [Arcticibacterium luteifluviistationis]